MAARPSLRPFFARPVRAATRRDGRRTGARDGGAAHTCVLGAAADATGRDHHDRSISPDDLLVDLSYLELYTARAPTCCDEPRPSSLSINSPLSINKLSNSSSSDHVNDDCHQTELVQNRIHQVTYVEKKTLNGSNHRRSDHHPAI
jgi:hypothetical protein